MEETSALQSLSLSCVQIWWIDVDKYAKEELSLFPLLSKEEQSQARTFVRAQDQQYYVITHGICRLILARYLSQDPSKIQIGKEEHGKPVLLDKRHSPFHFNLSHSADKALLAVAPCHVGVDMEQMNTQIPFDELVPHFMSTIEREQFAQLSEEEKCEAFYHCWTCKEAYVKAIGQGLSYPIKRVTIPFASNQNLIDQENPHFAEQWKVIPLPQMEDYCNAIVIERGKELEIELLRF